jgi:putative glutamine amidotransferase
MEPAPWGPWPAGAAVVPRDYLLRLRQAGAAAVVVPADPLVTEDPDRFLDLAHGLLLIGGPDIDPAHYRQRPHRKTEVGDPDRDRAELALARRAVERDLPVLAVCRGMQVLNVALGGTLVQHLPDVVGHHAHRPLRAAPSHEPNVRLAPGSLAARAAGEERHHGRSNHHQGVDRLGAGLVASGWALADGTPVAVEAPERTWVLGVQWHPEVDPASRVVSAFVAAVRATVLVRAYTAARPVLAQRRTS